MKPILVLFCVIQFSLLSFASFPKEGKVKRSMWTKELIKQSVAQNCESNSFFRQCYTVGKSGCKNSFKKIYKTCLKKENVPKKLYPEIEGVAVAQSLGLCAGAQFADKHKKQYKKDKICPKY